MTRLHDPVPRVLILGSCVSRDIVNFSGSVSSISLVDYYARSSIASLGAEPCVLDEKYLDCISSDFQRRMVRRDLSKAFLKDIAQRRDFDFILLDLIDERFDIYEVAQGSIATVSGEFLATRFITAHDRCSEHWIRNGSELHRELWKAGIKRLFAVLAELGYSSRVIVNKVFWADRMENGTPLSEEKAGQRQAANSLLAWMYEELENYVPATRWMEFSEELLRSNPVHRWGIAPFHYSDSYYTRAAVQLNEMYTTLKQDGGRALGKHTLVAWSGGAEHASHRTCFLVFKEKYLIHTQPYSINSEMRFDTKGVTGNYEVVIFTLIFDPEDHLKCEVQRRETVLSFCVSENVSI